MDFKQYLTERTKKSISEDEVIEIIKSNCKNININWPLYRGMTIGPAYQIIDTSNSYRISANTTNHYTIMIDRVLNKLDPSYPKRSKSLICSTNRGYADLYAEDHMDDNGALYVIVPFDDVVLGVCPTKDIWEIKTLLGNKYRTIHDINSMMFFARVPDDSYEDILDFLISDKWDRNRNHELDECFPLGITKEDADKKLMSMYSNDNLKFSFIKSNEISSYKNNEVWFSGKCIAILARKWKNICDTLNQ